jgi:hypothetical protein
MYILIWLLPAFVIIVGHDAFSLLRMNSRKLFLITIVISIAASIALILRPSSRSILIFAIESYQLTVYTSSRHIFEKQHGRRLENVLWSMIDDRRHLIDSYYWLAFVVMSTIPVIAVLALIGQI